MPPKKIPQNRTKEIIAWIHDTFGKYGGTSKLSVTATATLCGRRLGRKINPNTMCRLLRTCGVKFPASPNDPRERSYSKFDLFTRRIELLEERIKRLEQRGKK